ncbi:uncharacterized protein MONBRDRAFT_37888 [Monosiga brevicollis MX1]|uniref:Uncharacterized protein n=1 Tax=Monosiga brevicollis TaxID=81824 RepID=A9V4F3_MONBE|nr:uncharacterized protein MONBRDRAFT_37888 [Monosiga brevicollis MX1]EDQ87604.1 predicted protein [Monosiga brevicollis MX1]|eukprot:XP_001747524.1 hypothetical protein [Monosiga brevicollis MX1]
MAALASAVVRFPLAFNCQLCGAARELPRGVVAPLTLELTCAHLGEACVPPPSQTASASLRGKRHRSSSSASSTGARSEDKPANVGVIETRSLPTIDANVLVTVGKTEWPGRVMDINVEQQTCLIRFAGSGKGSETWHELADIQVIGEMQRSRRRGSS